jgi:hypothetical protein
MSDNEKTLDSVLDELEFSPHYPDPTAPTPLSMASQMKGMLIKNFGVEGAIVKEMPDEKYLLSYKGKHETLEFEPLLKKLIEIAKSQVGPTPSPSKGSDDVVKPKPQPAMEAKEKKETKKDEKEKKDEKKPDDKKPEEKKTDDKKPDEKKGEKEPEKTEQKPEEVMHSREFEGKMYVDLKGLVLFIKKEKEKKENKNVDEKAFNLVLKVIEDIK